MCAWPTEFHIWLLEDYNLWKVKEYSILVSHLIPTGTKCHSLKRKYGIFFHYTKSILRKFPIH